MSPAQHRRLLGALGAALLIFAASAIWLVLQQGVGTLSYFRCAAAGPPWGVALGVLAVLACAAAAYGCWRRRDEGTEARQFLMQVGAGSAAIFAVAALVMTAALVLVPACAR